MDSGIQRDRSLMPDAVKRVNNGAIAPAGERVLHTLVNTLPAFFYATRFRDGVAAGTVHGPQCERVTGYTADEYANDPSLWLKTIYPPDQEAVKKFFGFLSRMRRPENPPGNALCDIPGDHPAAVCNGQGHMLEYRITHKGGAVRWLANRCVATYDEQGGLLRLDGLVMDITGEKAAERQESGGKHAGGMDSADRRVENAVEQNNPFMSFVVHDIRSPIASVITYLKLLERQCNEGDFGGVNDVFRRIIGINEILLRQVDELLTVSQLKSGGIKIKKRFFEGFALIQRVISGYRLQAEMKRIELRCTAQPGFRLHADFNLAYEVISNLVSNAIKFCEKGNIVTISVRPGPIITVSNDGPAIDPQLLPNLFSFEKTTSTIGSMGERGTGLGLPLSAEFMRLLGGELRAGNGAARGCFFEAVFPPVRPVILVVDNDEVDRFTLKGLLSLLDVDVITAMNGKEALKIMQDREVHLIISDIVMPEMDGYEFLKILHENKRYEGIQFIALTGYPESSICQQVLGMGVDDFVKKPLDPDDLLLRVRRFVA